ncbi:hypothetical protein OS493_033740 [Desmophyllum pertusum]|uniref:Uncharacterized protein n=1 Tax=Desmophyllum pertusum TaxID=174260 RepID=A0A9W9Z8Y7_9CNID|nr:hypothetical protein OS493_033740 [Desmophyllum pertusum]
MEGQRTSLISFDRQPNKHNKDDSWISRFHSLFILNLKMYISAISVILCVFHIHSARAGVITQKLKLSQVSATQMMLVHQGSGAALTGTQSEIGTAFWDSSDEPQSTSKEALKENMAREETSGKVQRRAINSYPKGIWTRDENEETKHLDDNNVLGDCPPGMWGSGHVQLESDPRSSRNAWLKRKPFSGQCHKEPQEHIPQGLRQRELKEHYYDNFSISEHNCATDSNAQPVDPIA